MSSDRPPLSLPTWGVNTPLAHMAHALREFSADTSAGDALADIMAECLRAYLGPMQRRWILLTAMKAAETEHLEEFGFHFWWMPQMGEKNVAIPKRRNGATTSRRGPAAVDQ